jgi:Fic family protein
MQVDERTLRRFVRESNKIEGIYARPGTPLFDDHLAAARLAAKKLVHPNELHALLFRRYPRMRRWRGQYREERVYIGGKRRAFRRQLPRPEYVPKLMDDWQGLVKQLETYKGDVAFACQFLHDWYLCIHPHTDGNGRAARLIWNMLRVHHGLPWLVIYDNRIPHLRQRGHYYGRIRSFEERVFKPHYAKRNIYPVTSGS